MHNIIQANLNRARVAQALIMQTMYETKAQIAIISEPNKIPNTDSWYGSTDQSCAIYLSLVVDIIRHGRGHGFVWVDTLYLRIYSCYFSPSKCHTIDAYKAYLDRLGDACVRLRIR